MAEKQGAVKNYLSLTIKNLRDEEPGCRKSLIEKALSKGRVSFSPSRQQLVFLVVAAVTPFRRCFSPLSVSYSIQGRFSAVGCTLG